MNEKIVIQTESTSHPGILFDYNSLHVIIVLESGELLTINRADVRSIYLCDIKTALIRAKMNTMMNQRGFMVFLNLLTIVPIGSILQKDWKGIWINLGLSLGWGLSVGGLNLFYTNVMTSSNYSNLAVPERILWGSAIFMGALKYIHTIIRPIIYPVKLSKQLEKLAITPYLFQQPSMNEQPGVGMMISYRF
jgi:hypothetical protein